MSKDFSLAPIEPDDWASEIQDMRSGFAAGLNVYRTMAHHPALLQAWATLREHVVNRSALGRERSEIVILRTGVRLGSDYEWHQHILRARALGIPDRRIASMRGPIGAMEETDGVLASTVDDLFDRKAISPATGRALRRLVGTEGVLDVIATVGFYSTLGFILNSFDTPLDTEIAAELAAHPLACPR